MSFAYPDQVHQRRHGPSGYIRYESYKSWLRDEFAFRCVYCLERESWYPSGQAAFGVDHVKPKSLPHYQHLVCAYDNLVYACNRCNSLKEDKELLDPYAEAFGEHLRVDHDGVMEGLTVEGSRLIRVLGLNHLDPLATRVRYLNLLALYERYPDDPQVCLLYVQALSFPADLPNLAALRPPGGNSCRDGVRTSYYRQRAEGRLPEVMF